MLCVDVGDVPSALAGHLMPEGAALTYAHAHVPHRGDSVRELAPTILEAWRAHGWHSEWIEGDAAVQRVRALAPSIEAGTAAAYVKLAGCAEVRKFSTGCTHGLRLDEPAASDADAVAHGRVPRVPDPNLAPPSVLDGTTTLPGSRRRHLCEQGPHAWPEAEPPAEVVVRANGMRQIALLAARRVRDEVARLRSACRAPVLVFGSSTVSIGSHNGTNDDPWDTRSFCALCIPVRLERHERVSSPVALADALHGLVHALLARRAWAPTQLVKMCTAERLRVQQAARVVTRGPGWRKTHVHAALRWYCVLQLEDAEHALVFDLLRDPDMRRPLEPEDLPREVLETEWSSALDPVPGLPGPLWAWLPDGAHLARPLTVFSHRAVGDWLPPPLPGTFDYDLLAQLAAQRVVLRDIRGGTVALAGGPGAVQVAGARLLGPAHQSTLGPWLVHPVVPA